MSTTDSVIDILTREASYRELPRPFKVGSISFNFTHALIAGERANDLVIVIELVGNTADDDVIRRVMALTRGLDVMQSKRPVTAVLTSGQPRSETIHSISKVCRVLSIGAPTGHDAKNTVRDGLAVLLPLTQPPAVETLLDWEADLRTAIPASSNDELMDALLNAAPKGKEAVEISLGDAIAKWVETAFDGDGDDE